MTARAPVSGPLKLYVGSLHFNINEDMLKSIFEPFGTIEDAKIVRDSSTSRSQGYGYIYFVNAEEGKKALEQLDGFEVAGKSLKVNYVTDRSDLSSGNGSQTLDNDETDRTGVGLGPTGRLALMAKLAEGTGLIMPKSALNTLNAINNSANPSVSSAVSAAAAASASYAPPTCTQCFVLSNMFDPKTTPADVLEEIREDVLEECCKIGGVLHIYVDKNGPSGNIYLKCATITTATQCVDLLHGRYFSGRMVSANFVPLNSYHNLFPASTTANTLLKPPSG